MADSSMDLMGWLRKQLQEAHPDLLREMVSTFVQSLMSAEADALCGASYGERSPDRVNSRNGYREREWDTRVGTVGLEIPKLRQGSYFPDWLIEGRRRAERALVAVIAEAYLAGVSTRRVEALVQRLGIAGPPLHHHFGPGWVPFTLASGARRDCGCLFCRRSTSGAAGQRRR